MATSIQKLQKFQRLACLAITGCMRTTPTAAMEALLGLTPLHLHIQQEAAASAFRLKALNIWVTSEDNINSHTNIIEAYAKDYPLCKSVYDRVVKQYLFEKHYNVQLHEEPSDTSNTHELRIYTDGSKMEKGTGAGSFSDDLNIHISTPLGKYNSIFQAECVGIIQAATAIMNREVKNFNIRILSDSAAVLRALLREDHNSGLTIECHQQLEKASKYNNHITLQWIKGHSGSRGNDAADEYARRGSNMHIAGNEPMIPIPFSQIKNWIRTTTRNKHKEYWASIKDCRQSKLAFPELNWKYSRRLLSLNRDKVRQVVGIVTGHCPLNKHLFTVGVTDSPLCRGCMEADETAAHVLLECRSIDRQRKELLGSPSTMREACARPQELIAFIKDIGWLT